MVKPFDSLYQELESGLKLMDQSLLGTERYLQGIALIREKVERLRIMGGKFLRVGPKEVAYFREVWPVFYGKLLLYIQLHDLELRRQLIPAEEWLGVIGHQERKVAGYFRANRDFWQYYRSGALVLNEQFTRAYSREQLFNPLALVLDQDRATLASYKAAWGLAMESLREWLQEERAGLAVGTVSAADQGYSWGATDADLAEWLFGLQAVAALRYKGEPADISRVQKWSRLALGREVANIYDRFKVLRNRKKERVAFTKKILGALERKMDQAEGKFD